jgi:hypothetical protein
VVEVGLNLSEIVCEEDPLRDLAFGSEVLSYAEAAEGGDDGRGFGHWWQ